jgi:Dak2 domain-containing protein
LINISGYERKPSKTCSKQLMANYSGASLQEAPEQMADAAEKGKESTVNLVAKIGRSSRLGERSRGVLDAGAGSLCIDPADVCQSAFQLPQGVRSLTLIAEPSIFGGLVRKVEGI